jgi:ribonuclease HI
VPRIVENALLIYTDGSLQWRGRKGGYGMVFVHVDDVGNETVVDEHAPPGILGTTGNRMELLAVITAVKKAPDCACYPQIAKVVVRTDSRYVTENYKRALFQWSQSRWMNEAGRPIDNADLWRDFAREYRRAEKKPHIEWVKGHGKGRQKDPLNYAADKLAKASRDSPLKQQLTAREAAAFAPLARPCAFELLRRCGCGCSEFGSTGVRWYP